MSVHFAILKNPVAKPQQTLRPCEIVRERSIDVQRDRLEVLLWRWERGSRKAFEELVDEYSRWILKTVKKRLGARLRCKEESEDVSQAVIVRLLDSPMRVRVPTISAFKGLLRRVIENVICDRNSYYSAQARCWDREVRADIAFDFDALSSKDLSPEGLASLKEAEIAIQQSLRRLPEPSQSMVFAHRWDFESYEDLGRRFGMTNSAARMRCRRGESEMIRSVRWAFRYNAKTEMSPEAG